MKLTIFIGSPRAENSNSKNNVDSFLKGFSEIKGNSFDVVYIKDIKTPDSALQHFLKSEQVLLAFPLYVDSMPAIVKNFIEFLYNAKAKGNKPALGFMIKSGFPEALHSRYLEKYLEKLAFRLGCNYLGTVIKTSAKLRFRKFYFYFLGKEFAKTEKLDRRIIRMISRPERISKLERLFFNFALNRRNTNYWNKELRENDAFRKRFDKPYSTVCPVKK